MSNLEITGGGMTASISALGAELQGLSDHQGRDLLWNGDAAFWSGRAPILFPVIGALAGGQYRLDGATYPMSKHGFARTSTFGVIEHGADTAAFRLGATDATRAVYPFEFQLDVRFVVAASSLTIEASISNGGETIMPASFGFHPAFRWPLPYGQPREDHCLLFQYAEPDPVRRIDAAGLLTPELHPSPVLGHRLSLKDELFQDDALIFDHPRSRRVKYGAFRPRAGYPFFGLQRAGRLDKAWRRLHLHRTLAGFCRSCRL